MWSWLDKWFRRAPEPPPPELEAHLKGQVNSLQAQLGPIRQRATGAPKVIKDQITYLENFLMMLHNQIGVDVHARRLDQKRVSKDLADCEKSLRDLSKLLPP